MAGIVSFDLTLLMGGAEVIPELAARAKDLSPMLKNLPSLWAKENIRKFRLGEGKDLSGVDQGAGVFWEPDTAEWDKRKTKQGFPPDLMQYTGSTEASLTSENLFDVDVRPDSVLFGQPLNEFDAQKVAWNWTKRQAIFLNEQDIHNIRRELQDYFELGGNYREIKFAQGLLAVQSRKERAQMKAEFEAGLSE